MLLGYGMFVFNNLPMNRFVNWLFSISCDATSVLNSIDIQVSKKILLNYTRNIIYFLSIYLFIFSAFLFVEFLINRFIDWLFSISCDATSVLNSIDIQVSKKILLNYTRNIIYFLLLLIIYLFIYFQCIPFC